MKRVFSIDQKSRNAIEDIARGCSSQDLNLKDVKVGDRVVYQYKSNQGGILIKDKGIVKSISHRKKNISIKTGHGALITTYFSQIELAHSDKRE